MFDVPGQRAVSQSDCQGPIMPTCDTSVEFRVACLTTRARMPRKGYATDAGFDLAIPEEHALPPGVARRIDLEIALQIPHGWYGQIFGRSSVFQRGLSVHPGVIDADYRGSVQLLVENRRRQTLYVEAGERLAQLLILPVPRVALRRVSPEEIEPTRRGAGGFGSTGR